MVNFLNIESEYEEEGNCVYVSPEGSKNTKVIEDEYDSDNETNNFDSYNEDDDDDDSDEDEIKHNDWYDSDNTQSSKDQASYRVLYSIASLPKFTNGETVSNPFIPVQFAEEDGKIKDYLNPDVVDFDKTWNLLSKTLQNTYNYSQIYSKIEDLAKKRPEFEYLLAKLPNAEGELTEDQMNIKHQFTQDLSKPLVRFYNVVFKKDANGNLSVSTYKSQSSITTAIKNNFAANFSTSTETEFISPNAEGINTLNVDKLLKEFPQTEIKNSKKFRQEFLELLGFKFHDNTLNSNEFNQLIIYFHYICSLRYF